jgi:galactoside O-acetyltransferase
MAVKIFEFARVIGLENIEFGENVIIDDFAFIHAKNKIKLGNYTHIGCHAAITGGEYFDLGDFGAVSQGVKILTATDDFKDWGFGNSTVPEQYRNVTRKPIIIGKFCIVGANSVVLPGVTIGEGAMVGACSVVTRDLEPWGVYIGNKRITWREKEKVLENYAGFQGA